MTNHPKKRPSAPAGGNASNPAPGTKEKKPGKGMLDEKAEKYLQEGANIEDMPDPEEDQEAIEQMKRRQHKRE